MNTELILRVADAIEAHEGRFDMSYYFAVPDDDDGELDNWPRGELPPDLPSDEVQCGTVGCIAGWTMSIAAPNVPYDPETIVKEAADALGLDDRFAGGLFCASGGAGAFWEDFLNQADVCIEDIEAHHAVAALRALAAGELDTRL